jgi:cell volume regulation protein A
MPYRASILRFHEGMAWLSQMVMFILLGLLVFPSHLPPVIIPGLILAAGLMFVTRPVAVWLSTLGMGFAVKERVLLAWSGLRGAVPIILAT